MSPICLLPLAFILVAGEKTELEQVSSIADDIFEDRNIGNE
jgi:hypothetical protein